jgi:hypothetical protein
LSTDLEYVLLPRDYDKPGGEAAARKPNDFAKPCFDDADF